MTVTGNCALRRRWSRLRAQVARLAFLGGVVAGSLVGGAAVASAVSLPDVDVAERIEATQQSVAHDLTLDRKSDDVERPGRVDPAPPEITKPDVPRLDLHDVAEPTEPEQAEPPDTDTPEVIEQPRPEVEPVHEEAPAPAPARAEVASPPQHRPVANSPPRTPKPAPVEQPLADGSEAPQLPAAPAPPPPPLSSAGSTTATGPRIAPAILPAGPDLPDDIPGTPVHQEELPQHRLVPFELPASPD